MTPGQRIMRDPSLTLEEKLEDRRWRRTATPDQILRADALAALWYAEQADAEQFARDIWRLMGEGPER